MRPLLSFFPFSFPFLFLYFLYSFLLFPVSSPHPLRIPSPPSSFVALLSLDTDLVLSTALPLTETLERSGDMDGDGVITNMEFFQALDPNLPDSNDYVFDTFDWTHCDNIK